MESAALLHLHPMLETVAEELEKAGISCRLEGAPSSRRFRGVCLYTGGQLHEDILYVLNPGDEAQFPVDSASYLCAHPTPGGAGHLYCPNRDPSALLGAVLELFSRYQHWELLVDGLVFRGAGLDELCEAGARMLDNPVCIHDDWFIMAAASTDLPEVMMPEQIQSSTKMFIPRKIVEEFKFDADYTETYSHRTAQFWRSTPETPSCLYVNLWDGEVYRGRLLVIEHRHAFSSSDYMLTEFLTQRASLLMGRGKPGESAPYRSMDDVVSDLLNRRKMDPTDEAQLLTMLGWGKNDKFTCIRVQSQQEDVAPVLNHVLHSDLFRTFPGSYIMFERYRQCVILNLSRQNTTLPQLRYLLAPLCRDYCLYAGISSPVHGIRELHMAYHQADVALSQAFRLRSDRWILAFSDCALDYILSNLRTDLPALHLAAPELRLLMDMDAEKGTQYFDTLRTFLLLERDIPKTAAALIIHRTTLLYRLKKIQTLTELNLNDPQKRLYLLLSLRILDQEGQGRK